jgi:GNAT superfamily N-acetyltransferase
MPTPDAALRTSGEGGFRFAIRPARPDDAKALWLVHGRAVRALAGTHYTPDEREAWATRMRPEGYLEPMATRLLLVAATTAEEGSRIIGYGQLHVAEGTIDAIYVDPGWVRRGVGAALVDALERESRTRGLTGLVVEASLNSVPFYQALGYVAKGLDQHPLAPGVGIAFVVMEKRLTPAAPPHE